MPEPTQYVVQYTTYDQLQEKLNNEAKHHLEPVHIFFEPGRGIVVVFRYET